MTGPSIGVVRRKYRPELVAGLAEFSVIVAIVIAATMVISPGAWVAGSLAISAAQIGVMSWMRRSSRLAALAPIGGVVVMVLGYWFTLLALVPQGPNAAFLSAMAEEFGKGIAPLAAAPITELPVIVVVAIATILVDFISLQATMPAGALIVVAASLVVPIALGLSLEPLTFIAVAVFVTPQLVLQYDDWQNGRLFNPRLRFPGILVPVVAVVIAVIATPVLAHLPGAGALAQRETVASPGSGTTRFSRVVEVGGPLGERSSAPVLRYELEGKAPTEPWRVLVQGEFTGFAWQPLNPGADDFPALSDEIDPASNAYGIADGRVTKWREVKVLPGNLNETIAPLPYPSREISLASQGWRPYSGALMFEAVGTESLQGRPYTFSTGVVATSREELRTLDASSPAFDESASMDVQIPPIIEETAAKITAEAANDYDRLIEIQNYLRSTGGFRYDEAGPEELTGMPVEDFMTSRRGYCVQFATAMTLMARSAGIPTRYVEGFMPGKRNSDGIWEISPREMHAWPEAFFEGVGWVRFEPTPASQSGALPSWQTMAGPTTASITPEATSAPSPSSAAPTTVAATTPGSASSKGAPAWLIWGLATTMFLAAAAGATLAARRRSARLRLPWTQRVEEAWHRAHRTVIASGLPWPRAWSPGQVRDAYHGPIDDPKGIRLATEARAMIVELADQVEAARYAQVIREPSVSPEKAVATIRRHTLWLRFATMPRRIFRRTRK